MRGVAWVGWRSGTSPWQQTAQWDNQAPKRVQERLQEFIVSEKCRNVCLALNECLRSARAVFPKGKCHTALQCKKTSDRIVLKGFSNVIYPLHR